MGVTPPQVIRESVWRLGATTAGLTMLIDDGNAPATTWFDLATAPDMSGCWQVGRYQNQTGYGRVNVNPTFAGLSPATTYYYRGQVQTLVGSATGSIQSFQTAAATAPQPPSISCDRVELEVQDVLGWLASYTVNGHELGGTVSGAWSLNADMSGATQFDGTYGPQHFMASPTAQGFYSFIPSTQFPKGTSVYFQGTAQTAGGTTLSNVGSAVIG